jgi:hypothetical protein
LQRKTGHCTTTGGTPVVIALTDAGIHRWSSFILLTMDQVNNLVHQFRTTKEMLPLPVLQKHMVMMVLAPCHHASREIGRPMDPVRVTQWGCHAFHVEECNAEVPFVHWKTLNPMVTIQEVTREASAFCDLKRLSPTGGWMGRNMPSCCTSKNKHTGTMMCLRSPGTWGNQCNSPACMLRRDAQPCPDTHRQRDCRTS